MGKIRFSRSMMGCVPNYYCKCKSPEFCNIDHSGDYYPAADYEAISADYEEIFEEREKDKDEIKFLSELLKILYGDKWDTLTIHEAKKHSYSTALMVEQMTAVNKAANNEIARLENELTLLIKAHDRAWDSGYDAARPPSTRQR